MEKMITELVDSIVVDMSAAGYTYLKEAVEIAAKDMEKLDKLSREIYAPIAEKHGTTTKAVQQAIGKTISHTWKNGNWDTLMKVFGYTVADPEGKPTNGEFIGMLADKIWLMSR